MSEEPVQNTPVLSEQDDEEVPELQRSYAMKGPRYGEEIDDEILDHNEKYQLKFKRSLECEEEYEPEPDLDTYFDEFHLTQTQRIAMCRTYANYLTQKLRSTGRLQQPRQKVAFATKQVRYGK